MKMWENESCREGKMKSMQTIRKSAAEGGLVSEWS